MGAWWVVLYTADDWEGPLLSNPRWHRTAQEASASVERGRQGRTVREVFGGFDTMIEAESCRMSKARELHG